MPKVPRIKSITFILVPNDPSLYDQANSTVLPNCKNNLSLILDHVMHPHVKHQKVLTFCEVTSPKSLMFFHKMYSMLTQRKHTYQAAIGIPEFQSMQEFEHLLDNIPKANPKCRHIVFLLEKQSLPKYVNYMENLDEKDQRRLMSYDFSQSDSPLFVCIKYDKQKPNLYAKTHYRISLSPQEKHPFCWFRTTVDRTASKKGKKAKCDKKKQAKLLKCGYISKKSMSIGEGIGLAHTVMKDDTEDDFSGSVEISHLNNYYDDDSQRNIAGDMDDPTISMLASGTVPDKSAFDWTSEDDERMVNDPGYKALQERARKNQLSVGGDSNSVWSDDDDDIEKLINSKQQSSKFQPIKRSALIGIEWGAPSSGRWWYQSDKEPSTEDKINRILDSSPKKIGGYSKKSDWSDDDDDDGISLGMSKMAITPSKKIASSSSRWDSTSAGPKKIKGTIDPTASQWDDNEDIEWSFIANDASKKPKIPAPTLTQWTDDDDDFDGLDGVIPPKSNGVIAPSNGYLGWKKDGMFPKKIGNGVDEDDDDELPRKKETPPSKSKPNILERTKTRMQNTRSLDQYLNDTMDSFDAARMKAKSKAQAEGRNPALDDFLDSIGSD